MRSPAEMTVIQIDITNSCTKRCSNCTRFCGHHEKPYFMGFETFRNAVSSMQGFPGIVGMMGGEPTIHPQFEKFVRHFAENFGNKTSDIRPLTIPTDNFINYIGANAFDFRIGRSNQRGLFSSISRKYYEHFELIQDVFGVQCLNDHTTPSQHTTLMCTRKELGIGDEDWLALRDDCWVQNHWSAAITPKGAFFCEVAASLDMTFGGPGGWPVEPGWWRRKPQDFGDQLQWCERCSACLPVPSMNANDEKECVSPFYFAELQRINSRKLDKGLVSLFDVADYDAEKYRVTQGDQPYLDSNSDRVMNGTGILTPQEPLFLSMTDEIPHGAVDWVATIADPTVESAIRASISNKVFNPGCMYGFLDEKNNAVACLFSVNAQSLQAVDFKGAPFDFKIFAAYPERKIVCMRVS